MVHYGPGGSYDLYSRALAPVVSKILGTDVIVENKGGGGGVIGATYLWDAKPDGYTVGLLDLSRLTVNQMVMEVPYDIQKFSWLPQVALAKFTVAVAGDSSINSIDELRALGLQRPIRVACSDVGRTEIVTMNGLDIEHTFVSGHGSNLESTEAVIRGDADIVVYSTPTLAQWYLSGDMKPILVFSDTADQDLIDMGITGVETSKDVGYPQLSAMVSARVLAGPPGLPDDIYEALNEAFWDALDDAELLAWAEASSKPVVAAPADGVTDLVDLTYNMFSPYEDLLKEYLGG
ncbi:Bug family tripartite tricarboxylate transporter substrate binding protein [Chloroflexota bacterium]